MLMRASVERRRRLEKRQQKVSTHATRWVVYGGLVIVSVGVLVGANYYEGQSVQAAEQSQAWIEQGKKDAVELIERVVARRLAHEAGQRKLVADEIAAQAQAGGAVVQPGSGRCNFARAHSDPTKIDVMVNKKHCLIPLNFTPELVHVGDATIRPEAAADYRRLTGAAAAAGYNLHATSSYRSFATQVSTYRYWLADTGGNVVETNKYSALPGYSEHQTGLTVDVAIGDCALHCVTTTPAYRWLQEHAHAYGFVERYPLGKESITGYAHESWHYRYIGVEAATDMKQKSVQTLEEYWDMLGGDYDS